VASTLTVPTLRQFKGEFLIIRNAVHFVKKTRTEAQLTLSIFPHINNVHVDVIKVFFSPTDAQVNCIKNGIQIYIKTAPTCFGAVTPSLGRALFLLAKVTVVKIAN
jgi:hypothetical protein